MVLLFLNDAKSTLKSLYCCFCLNDGILYPATITCQSERNKKQPQLFTLIHVAVLLYDLSSITSIVQLSSEMRTKKNWKDFLILSTASFLTTRRNSHCSPACIGKGHMENRCGMCVPLHLNIFFLQFRSHLQSFFQTEEERTVLSRDSVIQPTAQSLECSFANFYGLRFLLSAVTLPYCDLQWVYVPSSRKHQSTCLCVRARVRVRVCVCLSVIS